MSFVRAHKLEIGIFALALVARLLYFGLSYSANGGDFATIVNGGDGYYDISQNIIAGNGYSIAHEPPYIPTSYRTPGMPYFIAWAYFFFGSYFAVLLLHIFIGSLVPVLGMRIARYITNVRAICIAVGVFLALEPTSVLFSTVFLSEIVFTFLFLLSFIFLFRYWKERKIELLLVSAFLLGLSTLTRPTVMYLPVIMIALIIWEARAQLKRTVFLRAGLYVLVFLLTLSPWLYRNYQTFGVLGLSSQQGTALYVVTVPSVLAIERGTSFAQEYNTTIAGPNEASFAQSAEYSKLAMPILLSYPRALALMSASTAFNFFTNDGIYDVLRHINLDGDMYTILSQAKHDSGIQLGDSTLLVLFSTPLIMVHYMIAISTTPLALVFLGRAFWLLVTITFFMSVWRYLRHKRKNIYALAAVSVVVYLMLTTLAVGFTTNYRYRMPVNAFVFTFAVYEIVILAPWFRKKYNTLRFGS